MCFHFLSLTFDPRKCPKQRKRNLQSVDVFFDVSRQKSPTSMQTQQLCIERETKLSNHLFESDKSLKSLTSGLLLIFIFHHIKKTFSQVQCNMKRNIRRRKISGLGGEYNSKQKEDKNDLWKATT